MCQALNTELDDLISDNEYNESSACSFLPNINSDAIGRNIKRLRTEKKLSQDALGEILGVTRQTISRWETAIISPEFINVISLSDYFAVMPSEILFDKPEPLPLITEPAQTAEMTSTVPIQPCAQGVLIAAPQVVALPSIAPAEPKKPIKRGKLVAIISACVAFTVALAFIIHASIASVIGIYSPILDLLGSSEENAEPSVGLEYSLSWNRCSVIGIGQCTDTMVIIPSSYKNLPDDLPVTSVKENAFSGNEKITKVVLPNTLTTIENNAFSRCGSLESINIPFQVSRIGEGAFRDCSKLTSVTLPEGFTEIKPYTFYGCYSLEYVVLPKSIDRIEYLSFFSCSSLKKIYYKGDRTDWSNVFIDGTNKSVYDASIYVYSASKPNEEGLFWHYVNGKIVEW